MCLSVCRLGCVCSREANETARTLAAETKVTYRPVSCRRVSTFLSSKARPFWCTREAVLCRSGLRFAGGGKDEQLFSNKCQRYYKKKNQTRTPRKALGTEQELLNIILCSSNSGVEVVDATSGEGVIVAVRRFLNPMCEGVLVSPCQEKRNNM